MIDRPGSLAFWLGITVPSGLVAQQQSIPITAELPPTVRTAGFNGAGTALIGDAGSVFINPAGLATIRYLSVEGSYRPIQRGTFLATGALAWRIGQFNVGFGGRYFDLGSTPRAFAPSAPASGEPAYEALGTGSLIYRFGIIAIGGTGKYFRQRVGQTIDRAVSFDAGIALAFFDIAAFAFSVQNIGGNWVDSTSLMLPRTSRFGFTMNYVDPQETFRLLSTLEVQWVEGRQARGVLGAEAGVVISGIGIVGRIGYAGRPSPYSASEVTFGGTVTLGRFLLDYAYRPDDLQGDDAHLAGLRLTF